MLLDRLPGVREGRPGDPAQRAVVAAIALEAWGTDILRERSFIWLLGSRLFILMATSSLITPMPSSSCRTRSGSSGRRRST